MISLEKLKILAPLQKLPKSVADLGKIMLPKALKSCPESNKSSKSGHTAPQLKLILPTNVYHKVHTFWNAFFLPTYACHTRVSIHILAHPV